MLKASLLNGTLAFTFALGVMTLGTTGCGGNSQQGQEGAEQNGAAEHDHGHDHDHAHEGEDHAAHDHDEHAHEMGPHGGHMLHLDPGGEHAEWVHLDQENEIQVFLDESLLPVESVEMHVEIGGNEQDPYTLEPAEDALGKGAYRLVSDDLLTHIKMSAGEGVDVQLVVNRGSGTLTAPIEHHEH